MMESCTHYYIQSVKKCEYGIQCSGVQENSRQHFKPTDTLLQVTKYLLGVATLMASCVNLLSYS